MKRIRQLVLSSMGVSALILICAMTYRIQMERAAAEAAPPVPQAHATAVSATLPSATAPQRGYVLRIYGRGLGVFREGETLPERVVPAELSLLTELDRETLESGISAESPAELQALLEDFTS